uniref:Uncharacterized protein n=1 Tax=Oryza meridionalis TaxID=40149 RepID=A0A0E0D962_9ORYZ
MVIVNYVSKAAIEGLRLLSELILLGEQLKCEVVQDFSNLFVGYVMAGVLSAQSLLELVSSCSLVLSENENSLIQQVLSWFQFEFQASYLPELQMPCFGILTTLSSTPLKIFLIVWHKMLQ